MTSSSAEAGGGSLLIAWQLKNKTVLVVGGGDVASGRIESVLVADASVKVIAPRVGLHSLTKRLIENSSRVSYNDRAFSGSDDLEGVDMVLTAIDDVAVSREIVAMCRERKIPVNAADLPESCDFYFGSQIRDGPLQIMISTNGQSPKLANIIRSMIERAIPDRAGEAIERVGDLRSQLKVRAPGVGGKVGQRRMRWMVDICTAYEVEELALLDNQMIKKLLDSGWEKNRIPSKEELGFQTKPTLNGVQQSRRWVTVAWGFCAGAVFATLVLITSPGLQLAAYAYHH